jgi:6-phosphogluconolactonase (cycloisomerase 2 family)
LIASSQFAYVGTYTNSANVGIYGFSIHPATGDWSEPVFSEAVKVVDGVQVRSRLENKTENNLCRMRAMNPE